MWLQSPKACLGSFSGVSHYSKQLQSTPRKVHYIELLSAVDLKQHRASKTLFALHHQVFSGTAMQRTSEVSASDEGFNSKKGKSCNAVAGFPVFHFDKHRLNGGQ